MPVRRIESEVRSRQGVNLLAPLPPAETYEPGVRLTSQGEMAGCVYLVTQGMVKLFHRYPDGREWIVELAAGGDLVGAQPAVLGEPCLETAVTLTECRLARWRAPEFLARLNRDAGLAIQVCRMISRHVRALQCRLLESGVQPARWKFEGLLRWWADAATARPGRPAGEFDLPLSRDELGQFLFIAPCQVSRLLSAAEKDGLIARQGRRIRVLPNALRPAAALPA
ncbi:MAG: Crp/Fnr family transcriptional regulator [Bryobacteraceae bacterium]